ncbi:MAG: integration host factor subunit beta [Proteobacteria bacterium]|nr:integration host factor subunit beta [Pseudomonadota bacterium]
MTKSEIIRILTEKHRNLFLKDVTKLVETVFDEITAALARGDRVELRGFGSFSVRQRKARTARNPKTNEVVTLDERFSPYFRAGKELRERINKPQQ